MPDLHAWARAWWGGSPAAGFRLLDGLLWPVELLYRAGSAVRLAAYRRGVLSVARAPVPVVSVGNLSVGGTGKTPVAAFLARRLASRGHRPAVVLRGYGLDEVSLHRRWAPDMPVVAHADRREGVARAVEAGADVAILDDGFQHVRLARDLDLVLVSAEQHRALQTGRTLPRGPLREPPAALQRADAILLTHRTADPAPLRERLRTVAPSVPVVPLRLAFREWMHLDGTAATAPTQECVAVASVGEPQGFAELLARAGTRVSGTRWFPDHHPYTDPEIVDLERWAAGRTLLTTEKDAVKLAGRVQGDWRVLALSVEPEGDSEALDTLLGRIRP
ncbi:MAG: tetraacyldisaccharide 4'-kinase [Gemmatimonadetes bacterium]|nr:tetraacyldisaccharide 4'-kinase [Gemmatimonadota bacterium]